MRTSLAFVFLFLTLTSSALGGDEYTGTFISIPECGSITLVLNQDVQGRVHGTMTGEGMELVVQGTAEPPGISGTVSRYGTQMKFTGQLQGDQLIFELIELDEYGHPDHSATETLILQRRGEPLSPTDTPQAISGSGVVINGTLLSGEQLSSLEQRYNVRIQEGAYWYDKVCGAWGLQGGPTAGFILPNLDLGGTLSPDASHGTTGVFINGRQLHTFDVLALQQLLGTIIPGRYWLDALGNVGIEGGAMLFNIIQLSNAARSRGRGSTIYRSKITGIGAGSSGGTSYVMGKDWAVMVGP